ncbi:MAG TPA: amidohydrolase family protein [Bryobacteraceae bacterium]|nr:amidohydrolase family protein [Bryobacteraceae bacterium]
MPVILGLSAAALQAQTAARGMVDVHVHYNGQKSFLEQMLARLDKHDGMAFLLTPPQNLDEVAAFLKEHPQRFTGFGSIRLDDPDAVAQVDRFQKAGFRGLGEMSGPLKNYDDKSYWPIYERAQQYGMILLFHTGIVMRPNPETPSDISVDRMRPTTLDNIARQFPKLTIIGAHLGNPDYAWAAEIARWNPNIYFDLSGSTLIKLQENYQIFKSLFWWSSIVSPHTPKSSASAFEKIVFGSDVFGGEIEEFDREIDRYKKMLDSCGVSPQAQANIFGGTMRKILAKQ